MVTWEWLYYGAHRCPLKVCTSFLVLNLESLSSDSEFRSSQNAASLQLMTSSEDTSFCWPSMDTAGSHGWPNEHVNDCNPKETPDDGEKDLSMKSKSKVSTTNFQVSKLKRRGHPWPPYCTL